MTPLARTLTKFIACIALSVLIAALMQRGYWQPVAAVVVWAFIYLYRQEARNE